MTKPNSKEVDAVGWDTWHVHYCSSCYKEFSIMCPGKKSNPDHTIPSLCAECRK